MKNNGNYFLASFDDGTIRQYQLDTKQGGDILIKCEGEERQNSNINHQFLLNDLIFKDAIYSMAISKDDQLIVFSKHGGLIEVRNLETMELIHKVEIPGFTGTFFLVYLINKYL